MVYESKRTKAQKLMSNSRAIGGIGGYFNAAAAPDPITAQEDPDQPLADTAATATAAAGINPNRDGNNDDGGGSGDNDESESDGDDSANDDEANEDIDDEYWPKPAMDFFDLLKKEVDDAASAAIACQTSRS
jgi:hypothetical protein